MKAPDTDRLLQDLRRDGCAVLPGHAAGRADGLLRDHRAAFASTLPGVFAADPLDGEDIRATTLPSLRAAGLDALADVLGAVWFGALARAYFRAGDEIADPVLVSLALDGPKRDPDGPGNHLTHWDPFLSMRLMLYVVDVTRANGAIEVKRGTHAANHRQRLAGWREGAAYDPRPVCAGADRAFEAIEAPAGTIVLFDTSVTHRRGLVAPGRERRVAFIHAEAPLGRAQREGAALADVPRALHAAHLDEGHDRGAAAC